MENGSVSRTVTVFDRGCFRREERELVEEVGFSLVIGGREAGRMSCSPWNIREAAVGTLYMQGVIRSAEEVLSLDIPAPGGTIRVATRSAPQPTVPFPGTARITAGDILALSELLEQRSQLFRRTGGVHCAALARGREFIAYEEDVSRHAAVDKLAGHCLLENIPMAGSILVFSGRVPGEIVHKAAAMGCSAIIARSAPTGHACRTAAEKGIALVGFAREDSFNVYSHEEYIAAE